MNKYCMSALGKGVLTLLLGLVLLLILSQQHVVGQTSPRHGALQTHAMALARQTTRAEAAIGQDDTALLLDIDGTLRFRSLLLGLVLLLFLGARLPVISFKLPLLALLRTFAVDDSAFDCLARILAAIIVLTLFFAQRGILGFFGLFFLLQLLLLLAQAIADMGRGRGAKDGAAAVLALHRVYFVVDRATAWEAGERLLLLAVHDRGSASRGRSVFVCGSGLVYVLFG